MGAIDGTQWGSIKISWEISPKGWSPLFPFFWQVPILLSKDLLRF